MRNVNTRTCRSRDNNSKHQNFTRANIGRVHRARGSGVQSACTISSLLTTSSPVSALADEWDHAAGVLGRTCAAAMLLPYRHVATAPTIGNMTVIHKTGSA